MNKLITGVFISSITIATSGCGALLPEGEDGMKWVAGGLAGLAVVAGAADAGIDPAVGGELAARATMSVVQSGTSHQPAMDLDSFADVHSFSTNKQPVNSGNSEVNSEGYRHYQYAFNCGYGEERTVPVPYKTEEGLALTKQYAKAASCNHIDEMQRLAQHCESLNRPHCIER
ncbi:hypothetical protein PVT68_12295 [Microbulbifer bruguierae]|uniref:Lipoprotein n=1 Tax=Microbulbifer bruguierae TaxID=3029061 RepID=A0ABY8NA85_9GAMM|nr:hypothetical protein [Microbulbifer bruguierae]WGL15550.1 hypothetical protein PVT68_12295 [Microbulbifer bruguierae]